MTAATLVALLALGLVLLGAWVVRVRRYRAVFRLPRHRDDLFACRGPQESYEVPVDAAGAELPPGISRNGQTAFLTLSLRSTFLGRWRDPFLEIRAGAVTFRQYFERGVRGSRQLNVSPVFQAPEGFSGSRLHVRGSAVRWRRRGTLTIFQRQAITDAGLLVLAPHPDDSELAAFGLYAGHPSSWVVTVTAGDGGRRSPHDAPLTDDVADHAGRARLRVWDSLTVPRWGGVPQERCLNLAYPDGQLRAMSEAPQRPHHLSCQAVLPRQQLRSHNGLAEFRTAGADCTWGDLVSELRLALDRARPDVVVCPHPVIDAHPDHRFTTVALEQAIRAGAHKPRSIYLYVIHRQDAPVFPFGPAHSLTGPPPWQDARWVADGLISWPLTEERRREKYFAVEAAHDLRPDADLQAAERKTLRQFVTAVKLESSAFLAGTGRHPASFLRRAPRPNEFFCAVSVDSLSELVSRAMSEQAPAED